MDLRPVPDKLATASLTLGILGWAFYFLQWCFDLTIGLLLAAMTAGSSAICTTVLDVLPFTLWLTGIVAGHVALGQIRQIGVPGHGRAVWGLVLGYTGIAITIFLTVIIIVLITMGVSVGFLVKFLPSLPRR